MKLASKGGKWLIFLGVSLLLFGGFLYGKDILVPTKQMAPASHQQNTMM